MSNMATQRPIGGRIRPLLSESANVDAPALPGPAVSCPLAVETQNSRLVNRGAVGIRRFFRAVLRRPLLPIGSDAAKTNDGGGAASGC